MMKRFFAALLVCLLFALLAVPAFAEGDLVIMPNPNAAPPLVADLADILDEEEEMELTYRLAQVSADYNVDVVLVTTDDAEGKSSEAYADDYFDYNGYGRGEDRSGVLLLADFDNRELHVSTRGVCLDAFWDSDIDLILDYLWDDFVNGYYYSAFMTYADTVDSFLWSYYNPEPGPEPEPDPEPMTLEEKILTALQNGALGSAGAGIAAGLISTGVMKGKLKSVSKKAAASDYQRRGSFRLTRSNDIYLYSHTVTRRIPRDEGRSSSGGGYHSGSSGSSSHISSSGASHGGGGRKF